MTSQDVPEDNAAAHESGTVLLTGATGFVGRQVLRALDERGARVRVVVRERSRSRLAHRPCIESIVTTPDLFAQGREWWAETCRGIDIVIHVAWYTESGRYLQSEKNVDCLIGTLQMAKGAVDPGVRRFVGVGTCFEYDLAGGRLSVDTPLRPTTLYGGAKVAAFTALSQWFAQQGREFAWCRLFYLHGEGEDERRLVPHLRASLARGEPVDLGSGSQVRDYLDVCIAGDMIADVALGREQGPVNVCSGVAVTLRELAERIADDYGRRDLLRFGARPSNLFDPPCVVGVPTRRTGA